MKNNDSFDLGNIDTVSACNAGFEVELRHPATNAPLGVFWTVLGSDSDVFRDYIKESANERLRKEAMSRKKGRDVEIKTIQDIEQETINMLTVCSAGWRTGDSQTITFKGESLPFNVPNVKKVLTAMPWVRTQLDEAMSDLANFMKS